MRLTGPDYGDVRKEKGVKNGIFRLITRHRD
jgi:hypothetical protein